MDSRVHMHRLWVLLLSFSQSRTWSSFINHEGKRRLPKLRTPKQPALTVTSPVSKLFHFLFKFNVLGSHCLIA